MLARILTALVAHLQRICSALVAHACPRIIAHSSALDVHSLRTDLHSLAFADRPGGGGGAGAEPQDHDPPGGPEAPRCCGGHPRADHDVRPQRRHAGERRCRLSGEHHGRGPSPSPSPSPSSSPSPSPSLTLSLSLTITLTLTLTLTRSRASCSQRTQNPTGNEDVTRIRNFFAVLSRRFRGFRGAFAGFAALSRRVRAASHTAQWCLRKDSQPFRKVSQLRIRVTSSLPVGFSTHAKPWTDQDDLMARTACL